MNNSWQGAGRGPDFLPIAPLIRAMFIYFLLIYRVVFPLISALTGEGVKDLLILRVLAELLLTILLLYPFIFYRKEYGWLHPLVLPLLYVLGKTIAKNPLIIFDPIGNPMVDLAVETSSNAAVLSIPLYDLAVERLNYTLISCLAQMVYLAAFLFGPKLSIPRIRLYQPTYITAASLVFIGGLIALATVLVVSKGGLEALLIAMRSGRGRLLEGQGQFVFAGTVAPVIATIWYMYEKRPLKNPLFLLALLAALATALIVSGSRSALIMPLLTIVVLWWKKKGRALILPTIGAALVALFVVGGFGAIRQDWHSTSLDISTLNPFQAKATFKTALDDIAERQAEEAALATLVGAHEKGLLWGRSYLNSLTFWVPRALWPDKPVGIDKYNNWINFQGNVISSSPDDAGVWGIPVNARMEAYWNFGLAGVIVVFALIGCFHATLVRAAYDYSSSPFFWGVYCYIIVNFDGSSKQLVGITRDLLVVSIFAVVAGILRPTGGREGVGLTRST